MPIAEEDTKIDSGLRSDTTSSDASLSKEENNEEGTSENYTQYML